MIKSNACWCGSGRKYVDCHFEFDEKLNSMEFDIFKSQARPSKKLINNEADIEGIRKSGLINTAALDLVAANIKAGLDTETLDDMVHDFIVAQNGIPACLNYEGYPKSTCISINEVVCHGIPSKKTVLKDGDIVNVDITTILDGYYADASRMFMIGNVLPEAEKLVRVANECMELGIAAVKPWHFVGDIGAAVEAHAKAHGYSVVTELGGHGVGKEFHQDPFIAHVGKKGTGMLLAPGMVITVEPMINAGKYKVVIDKKDNWTVTTKDKSLSAQWEKTILVTETGVEVLTY